jgi:hypothetical protein
MNRIAYIFCAALAGIILFQFLFYKCERRQDKKENDGLREQLAACVNAPESVRVDTIRTVLTDTIRLPFTRRVVDTVMVQTTDWEDCPIEKSEYTGVYKHPQFEVHWTATVTGVLNDMYIKPPSLIKSLVITKEKTVDLTQYNTEKPKEKSHLYTTFRVGIADKQLDGADVGLMYIRKEGWGLSAGLGTNFNQLTYHGGLIIRLK